MTVMGVFRKLTYQTSFRLLNKPLLNSFINITPLYSCIVSTNGSGLWWFFSCKSQGDQAWKFSDTRSWNWSRLAIFLVQFFFCICLMFLCYCPSPQKKGSPLLLILLTLPLVLLVIFCIFTFPCTYLAFYLATYFFSVTWIPPMCSCTCLFTSHILIQNVFRACLPMPFTVLQNT